MEFEMMELSEDRDSEEFKTFMRRHWKMVVVGLGGIAGAAIAGVWVFLWLVAVMQATGMVPALLGQWTIGYMLGFCLHVVFWELLLVGSWVLVGGVLVYFQWFKKLPAEEQAKFDGGSKRGRSAGEGGGLSFVVGLTWLVLMWFAGRWNLAFQAWTLNDWVYTWLAAILWDVAIFSIPAIIFFLWWLNKKFTPEA